MSKDQIIQFNTGCHYTKHGQRITAVPFRGMIYFFDHDRSVDGVIHLPFDKATPTIVDRNYLNNNYTSMWSLETEDAPITRAEMGMRRDLDAWYGSEDMVDIFTPYRRSY